MRVILENDAVDRTLAFRTDHFICRTGRMLMLPFRGMLAFEVRYDTI